MSTHKQAVKCGLQFTAGPSGAQDKPKVGEVHKVYHCWEIKRFTSFPPLWSILSVGPDRSMDSSLLLKTILFKLCNKTDYVQIRMLSKED